MGPVCRLGASIPSNGSAKPLAVVQEQLGHLFVTAVGCPFAVAEEDVGPRRDARDLLTNDLPRTRCLAESIDEIQDIVLRFGVVTARSGREPFDLSNDRERLFTRHPPSQVSEQVTTEPVGAGAGCDAPPQRARQNNDCPGVLAMTSRT